MRPSLLLLAQFAFGCTQAQVVLFAEDFSSPTTAFTLNTTDVSSVTSGDNTWLVNDVYSGGAGTIVCIAPLPFTVPATPGQPVGIGSPNGRYLHTSSTAALNSGVQCCSFIAADGFCTPSANHFARMSADVNSVGQGDVTLSFWWLCGGGTNNYGEVYYSTNGGASWTLITTPIAQYRNQFNWVQQSIMLPAFTDQATLRFGFRFFNSTTFSAQDPGFAIDDVRITATASVPASVTTGTISQTAVCAGDEVQVPYTASGAFGVGNIFTAQLSDAAGSFAAPVPIGALASTASGTIAAIIPPGTPMGTAYRIRVVSSDPVVTGPANANDITVSQPMSAGADVQASVCAAQPPASFDVYLDGGDTGGVFLYQGLPASTALVSVPGNYLLHYVVGGGGACANDTAAIDLVSFDPPNAGTSASITACADWAAFPLFPVLGGADEGGTWTGPAGSVFSGEFDPASDPAGIYTYYVQGQAPCPDAQASVALAIDPCLSINERTVLPSLTWTGQVGFGVHQFTGVGMGAGEWSVLDVSGRSIASGRTNAPDGRLEIDLRSANSGTYVLRYDAMEGVRSVRFMHVDR